MGHKVITGDTGGNRSISHSFEGFEKYCKNIRAAAMLKPIKKFASFRYRSHSIENIAPLSHRKRHYLKRSVICYSLL